MEIAAVLLAAGEGRRLGGCKALLRAGERSFAGRCAEALSRPGVSLVIAVLGHDAGRVASAAGLPRDVVRVENRSYRAGMLGSVLCGLEAAAERGADAVLLHPVDHPLVERATVDRVVEALRAGAFLAVPCHAGRRGHPGGFAGPALAALRLAPAERGARAVLADHPEWIVGVAGDAGCVTGIDTPEDYARAFGQPPEPWPPGERVSP